MEVQEEKRMGARKRSQQYPTFFSAGRRPAECSPLSHP